MNVYNMNRTKQDNIDKAKIIRMDQVMQLYDRLPIAAGATFVIATILIIGQWPVIDHSILLGWWGAMVVITAGRCGLVFRFRRAKPNSADIETWAFRFFIGTLLAGFAWGTAAFFLFPGPDAELVHQFIYIFVMAGMSSASVTTLAPVWEDMKAFLLLMLVPLIVRFALVGTKIYWLMTAMILLHLIGLGLSARRMHKTLLEVLNLRISEMQQGAKLIESEERYRDLFENATDLIQSVSSQGRFFYVNRAWKETLGYSDEEIAQLNLSDIIHPHNQAHVMEIFRRLNSGEKIGTIEAVFVSKDGRKVMVEGNVSCRIKNGKPVSTRGIFRDITRRKRMEEKVQASLREKEILLMEIHHRVKNNLQTISSLLNLQSGYVEDKDALRVFKNSQERVHAMALIHEKLYQSGDLSKIDFAEYIRSLVSHLFDTYYLNPGQVQADMQIENLALGIETAIPLGLIINELVSNSLKHAFPGDHQGELHVTLRKSKDKKYDYTLIVSDNGVGFPRDLDFHDSKSLGMILIQSLVKQLHGVITMERNDGTTFTVTFKKLK